jgi:hypothetical protein
MLHRSNPRAGTILIIVAGIAALLASMALAFLVRMRSDAEESALLNQEVQARLMLNAALNYISESARLGWNDEAYGWIDVRDGLPGPRNRFGVELYTDGTRFPAVGGTAARCPMYAKRRPPYAVKLQAVYNRVPAEPSQSWAELISGEEPNPQPVKADWTEFEDGDPRPATQAMHPSWFRIYREAAATFVISCGSGATLGFRSWTEAVAAGEGSAFASPEEFAEARRHEFLLWYRAEWTPAIARNNYQHYYDNGSNYRLLPIGSPRLSGSEVGFFDDHANSRQFGGTFSYIEWISHEPPQW